MNTMKKTITQLQKEIKDIALTSTEKSELLKNIINAVPQEDLRSDIWMTPRRISSYSFLMMFSQPKAMAFLLILMLITSTGATSVFAEYAVPGDTLYPIKTNLNEPVVGLFVVTKENNVKWQETLTERRLQEAQVVIARGDLNQETRQLIEHNVEKQLRTFTEAVGELSDSESDDSATLKSSDLTFRVEAALIAHQEFLNKENHSDDERNDSATSTHVTLMRITNTRSDTRTETQEDSKGKNRESEKEALISSLKKREDELKDYRKKRESKVGSSVSITTTIVSSSTSSMTISSASTLSSSTVPAASLRLLVEEKQKVAQKIFQEGKQAYEQNKKNFTSSTENLIRAKLTTQEKLLEEASSLLQTGSYTQALSLYQSSISTSNEIKILILTKEIKREIEVREASKSSASSNSSTNKKKDESSNKGKDLEDKDERD